MGIKKISINEFIELRSEAHELKKTKDGRSVLSSNQIMDQGLRIVANIENIPMSNISDATKARALRGYIKKTKADNLEKTVNQELKLSLEQSQRSLLELQKSFIELQGDKEKTKGVN